MRLSLIVSSIIVLVVMIVASGILMKITIREIYRYSEKLSSAERFKMQNELRNDSFNGGISRFIGNCFQYGVIPFYFGIK